MIPLALRVAPGERAPDVVFDTGEGTATTLRRLRGRRVALVFRQSWSAPSLRELRRLQERRGTPDSPFVLAVNGGETRETIAEVRRAHALTLPLVHDPEQVIPARYGVRCWPTTVHVNEEGIVESIQFGMTHAHARAAGDRA